MPAAELAKAVLELSQPADRVGLVASSADGVAFQLLLPPDADAARATALARALGNVTTGSVTWPPAQPLFTIELLAAHGSQLVMPGPSTHGHSLGRIPDGSFFVAFLGTFPTGVSARAGDGAWVHGYATNGISGWIEARHVVVEEGCVLAHDALANALSLRLHDRAFEHALVGNLHLYRSGHSKRGTYFAAEGFVAVLERHANCQRATLDTRIDYEGDLDELHHARDQEHGDTFLAISVHGENDTGERAWSIYPPLATEPSVTFNALTDPTVPSRSRSHVTFAPRRGPGGARGYWAFSVQHAGEEPVFYVSDGTQFSEFGAEVPGAPNEGTPTEPAPGATAPTPAPAPAEGE